MSAARSMKAALLSRRLSQALVLSASLFILGGCAGMSARDQNTAAGAGIGALAGAVLTGGSSVGTVGGAAIGGVIGSKVGK